MKNNSEIIFSLNIDDIQTVAQQEIDRELTQSEINGIKELVTKYINWYDAISDAIRQKISMTRD